jgi:hypothetical protein
MGNRSWRPSYSLFYGFNCRVSKAGITSIIGRSGREDRTGRTGGTQAIKTGKAAKKWQADKTGKAGQTVQTEYCTCVIHILNKGVIVFLRVNDAEIRIGLVIFCLRYSSFTDVISSEAPTVSLEICLPKEISNNYFIVSTISSFVRSINFPYSQSLLLRYFILKLRREAGIYNTFKGIFSSCYYISFNGMSFCLVEGYFINPI